MEKAKPFEDYFNDERLEHDKLARMKLTREIVHEIYPDVQERVSYAMPGFYPKKAKKATQQLFLLMANKNWLGLYGTQGVDPTVFDPFLENGIGAGKGSLQVPYDFDEAMFRQLLAVVIEQNFLRHGLDLK
ncbi:DUF1801 domain-containing protein [Lactococcus fujiensis]|uniref:YdhG-like domain-containing protein n=1 Tax=Lactococcus fujiensis JCM 16395 TaxID=1291764 RepID=A0A2A5RKD2_9LACT|nr:DUF1801 domain-containing protein [Lactococcus fujiensis]PCR99678.1 hypothetical protein RT41_GL001791 [Lactococcus fujiensis JCM 16395]